MPGKNVEGADHPAMYLINMKIFQFSGCPSWFTAVALCKKFTQLGWATDAAAEHAENAG